MLMVLARSLGCDLEIDTENPQLVVPCDIIDEEVGEAVLSVYLKSPPEASGEIIIAVDPGEARVGLALATSDELLYASTVTPGAFVKIVRLLSKYYRNLTILAGRAPAAYKLIQNLPPGVTVEFLDESALPPLRLQENVRGDASDAVRIYLRGRAVIVQRAILGD